MSAGTILLVKFDDREKLLPAVEKINKSKNLLEWNAIDGHYNLLLKLKNNDNEMIDSIKEFDGFSTYNSVDILDESLSTIELDPEFTYSYLFIETDKSATQDIKNTLLKIDAVESCISSTGNFDLVTLIKSDTFDKIDRIIENEIKELDGLLRLKQERVILLDTM